jgi:hypothetical protein
MRKERDVELREREREEGERCRKLRRESKSENDTYIYHGF